MVEPTTLEDIFPGLQGQRYEITSPQDGDYNCIAWAAGEVRAWWWPDQMLEHFWPPGVPREVTVTAFQAAFATIGYVVCDLEQLEPNAEKVALFALMGIPTHAARQLPSGRWTSKLGRREDIEHALHDLTGMRYGSVCLVMARPRAPTKGEKGEKEGT